jgi:hypothetical protein
LADFGKILIRHHTATRTLDEEGNNIGEDEDESDASWRDQEVLFATDTACELAEDGVDGRNHGAGLTWKGITNQGHPRPRKTRLIEQQTYRENDERILGDVNICVRRVVPIRETGPKATGIDYPKDTLKSSQRSAE